MPEHRRKFGPQFKAEAVQMVIGTGKPIAEVAREPSMMECWATGGLSVTPLTQAGSGSGRTSTCCSPSTTSPTGSGAAVDGMVPSRRPPAQASGR